MIHNKNSWLRPVTGDELLRMRVLVDGDGDARPEIYAFDDLFKVTTMWRPGGARYKISKRRLANMDDKFHKQVEIFARCNKTSLHVAYLCFSMEQYDNWLRIQGIVRECDVARLEEFLNKHPVIYRWFNVVDWLRRRPVNLLKE